MLPQDFKEDIKLILNNEYDDFISTYNEESFKGLRINTLKLKNKDILPFSLTSIPWCGEGFYYTSKDTPGKHVYHEMGLYYIQEPSAMMVAKNLEINEGDFVLDMCAAPGGKSTQAAAYLNNQGLIVSNEIIPNRAKVLSSNIERMGIKNAVVVSEDTSKLKKRFKNFFNKIIVDAPCSGEGMFRKIPEAVNEWSRENVLMCAERQKEILKNAVELLQENGRIIYSTCTFSLQEDENIVEWFLSEYTNFKLVKSHKLWPYKEKGEGHFFALFERGDLSKSNLNLPIKKVKQNPDFVKFVKEFLNVNIEYNTQFGDNLYLSPIDKLDGLKVLRCGLHLGELKKNRFEPSHSLALALKREDFKNVIDLNSQDKEVYKFLQGEAIETSIKGWGVVCVDGYPLGWFKGDGTLAKNHYPKGLRKEIEY